MALGIGETLQLIGFAIALLGGCCAIWGGFKMKRDKKISPYTVNKDKIEDTEAYCLWYGQNSIIYGAFCVLLSVIGTAFVFLKAGDLIVMPVILLVVNIISFVVRIGVSQKKFYKVNPD